MEVNPQTLQETKPGKPRKFKTAAEKLEPKLRIFVDKYIECGFDKAEAARLTWPEDVGQIEDSTFYQRGCNSLCKVRPVINMWLNESGYVPESLIPKFVDLLEATETRLFFKGDKVIEREVRDNQTQLKAAVELAKILGMYAPTRHEVTGKNGESLGVVILPKRNQDESK